MDSQIMFHLQNFTLNFLALLSETGCFRVDSVILGWLRSLKLFTPSNCHLAVALTLGFCSYPVLNVLVAGNYFVEARVQRILGSQNTPDDY